MAKNRTNQTAQIIAGAFKSSAVNCPVTASPMAIVVPAALTGSSFTFEASADGNTYAPLYDESTLYTVTVGTSRYIALKESVFKPVRYLKVVSNATGPSYETAIRDIIVVCAE